MTDVQKLEASFDKFCAGLEEAKAIGEQQGAEVGARVMEFVVSGATASAAYEIAIQLAKLNENMEKIRKEISVAGTLISGGGYP